MQAPNTQRAPMTPKDALCFAAAAVLLAPPGAVLADGALIANPPSSTRQTPIPATLDAVRVPSVVAAPVEIVPPAEELTGGLIGEPVLDGAAEASTEYPEIDLWDRIRGGFALVEIDSPLVLRHEAWYLNRPEYVERMIARSRRYLYHIVEEVDKRGMPMEIALLPMIESAYNPVAYSRARAAGMWQFIPSTGRKYGLQQTWWYDGRRDVLAATRAALDYLQFLHEMFGDWELALAAYNCGEGKVQRAIANNRRKGKPTDYMHLKLPRETRNYLPKLQAVKNIVSNPELFKLALEPLPNRPYFAVVNAPPHIDVVMAAKLAGVPEEEFRYLNPAHQRPVITPVANRQLLVPADKVEQFHANLESNDQPLVTWQTYQLKKGEKLDAVARKFDISLERVKEVNGLTGRKRIRPGQLLLVPMERDDAETNLDETYLSAEFKAPVDDYHKRTVYRVKSGDTLSSIARRYGTSVSKLRTWNALQDNTVRAGRRLTIWQQGTPRRQVARR
jgi:membrane-bound lytic murein transglycosylase D